MHPTQKKIYELAQSHNIETLGLRTIGKMIGVSHPQKVKYHLNKLIEKGYLNKSLKTTTQKRKLKQESKSIFISIPILGLANCGPGMQIAEERPSGHLTVSKRLVKNTEGMFAVRAVGNSMDEADVKGDTIEDGDYVLVDSKNRTPEDGDYVLSVIGETANIKKFVRDDLNSKVALLSESSHYYPPIYIHTQDFSEYLVNGKVVQVVKDIRPEKKEMRYEPLVD